MTGVFQVVPCYPCKQPMCVTKGQQDGLGWGYLSFSCASCGQSGWMYTDGIEKGRLRCTKATIWPAGASDPAHPEFAAWVADQCNYFLFRSYAMEAAGIWTHDEGERDREDTIQGRDEQLERVIKSPTRWRRLKAFFGMEERCAS